MRNCLIPGSKPGLVAGAFLALALVAAAPAGAAEQVVDGSSSAALGVKDKPRQEQKHLTMEEIVVTDDRLDGKATTAVTTRKIEQGRNLTIPDVLKNDPDIDVARKSIIGDSSDSLSIRGFGGARVLLNIDGRPVNSAGIVGGSYIDWSTMPLDNIEKIEIIKGGSSAKYGNNAIGGVINVVTKRPTTTPSLTFFSNYGYNPETGNMQNYRLSHSYKVGPVGYAVSGSYQKCDPYLWNSDFESKNFSSNLYVDMPLDGELTLGYRYIEADKGFARTNRKSTDPFNSGFYEKINHDYPLSSGDSFASPQINYAAKPGPGANWNKVKYYVDLGYTQPIGDALLDFKIYSSKETRNEKNYAATDVKPAGNKDHTPVVEGRLVMDRKVVSDDSSGGSLDLTLPIANHELLIGAEHKNIGTDGILYRYVDASYDEKMKKSSEYDPSQNEGLIWAYYIQDNWRISDRWQLTPGLRYDEYTYHYIHGGTGEDQKSDGWSPKLTATYSPTQHDSFTASVYQALRTPTQPESGWWAGDDYADMGVVIPKLKAEKNNAAELVYMHRFAGLDYVRLSAYHYEVKDYINRISFAATKTTPQWRTSYNIDEVKQSGISLDGRKALLDWLSLNASVTYQKSKVSGDMFDPGRLTDGLSNFPEWKGSLGAGIKLPRDASFDVSLRYVGSRESTESQTVSGKNVLYVRKMGDFITTDLSFTIPLRKHVELGLYAENIFGTNYEEVYGYPMPGRIVGTSLKILL